MLIISTCIPTVCTKNFILHPTPSSNTLNDTMPGEDDLPQPPAEPPAIPPPPPAIPPHGPPAFEDALKELMLKYDKEKADLASLVHKLPPSVVEHVHTIQDPSKQYRRLRHFSGAEPTPGGELSFEPWFEMAEQMIKEPSISDHNKKMRISESLLPPALGIVRKLPSTVTAADYLDSLDKVFGSACDGADLYASFREMHQDTSEVPSSFLTRLESHLDRVVRYKGLPPSLVDKSRLEQFIRGCVYDEPLVTALHLRQKRDNLPDYLNLLREVRVEEAAQLARVKMRQNTRVGMKTW